MPTLPPEGQSKEVYGTVTVEGGVTLDGSAGDTFNEINEIAGSTVVLGGGVFNSTSLTTVNEGDAAAFLVDAQGRLVITGQVPHDTGTTGANNANPVMIGGRASTAPPSAVADGDATRLWVNPVGAMVVTGMIADDESIGVYVNPVLIGAFASQDIHASAAAVEDGDMARLVCDLDGRLHVAGQALHDSGSASLSAPFRIAARAQATEPTAVSADGDTCNLWSDLNGRLQVSISKDVGSSLDHGSNRDVDASAEQLTASSITCERGVLVKADADNSGTVYIGTSDVTAGTTDATDGFPLAAGESVFIPIDNVNKVYAIGSAANQIVYWMKQ